MVGGIFLRCSVDLCEKIPFRLDVAVLAGKLRLERGSPDFHELSSMVDLAVRVGRPKAAYVEAYVEFAADGEVVIGGISFPGRLLTRNLGGAGRVFPYVATCGVEMDEVAPSDGDILKAYWWDAIKSELLYAAERFFRDEVKRIYRLGKVAVVRPGAGDADIWPVERQRDLFQLLDGVEERLGVRLMDSCLMIPNQTVSGILYPSERSFHSCEVCRREGCSSRRADFDQEMWEDTRGG